MPSAAPPDHQSAGQHSAFRWFLRGAAHLFSIPALILVSSFIGFAALAMEAGLTQAQAVFMTLAIWALPGKVVLIGAILSGSGLVGAGVAVGLSSIRLMPMVVSLVPELRAPGTRRWVLYALSHFVAVTSWVIAVQHVRSVPREMRTAWYLGVGATLTVFNAGVVAVVYEVAPHMPVAVSAALLMLMPMYFLTSLWTSARESASHVAMAAGLLLGPFFAWLAPEFSLVLSGVAGGGAAFLWYRLRKGRAAS